MTWMDEGMLKEVKVSEDLYINVVSDDEHIDLHSKQLDQDNAPGVLISLDELDALIEALMQLRKELRRRFLMDDWEKQRDDFDKEWRRSMKVARIYGILGIIFTLLLLVVLGGMVLILLRTLGVI